MLSPFHLCLVGTREYFSARWLGVYRRILPCAVVMLVYVVIATLAGLLAASFPARRASRLNVLDAISYE